MLKKGTIRQVIEVKKSNSTASLNVLDLTMGYSHYAGVPPSFDDMASEEYATSIIPQELVVNADVGPRPLRDEVIWGTISNKHAVSWPHVDDEGFATVTSTLTGGKLWGLMSLPEGPSIESVDAFDTWDPDDFDVEKTRFELLYLPPKCALYAPP